MAAGQFQLQYRGFIDFIADVLESGVTLISPDDIHKEIELGAGHTFTVFKGHHRKNVVAIKYFNFIAPLGSSASIEIAAESMQQNLLDASYEIRLMTNNILRRCPNVATLYGIFLDVEDLNWVRPALVMDLASQEYPTLTSLLDTSLSPWLMRYLINNIIDGLYVMHSIKICHGDVKPDNILIFPINVSKEIQYQARISDFGFAFVSGQTPRGSGTTGWSAPECDNEPQEPKSREMAYARDVYSAAKVMIKILDANDQDIVENSGYVSTLTPNLEALDYIRWVICPGMLVELPQMRPWLEDVRTQLSQFYDERGLDRYFWNWNSNTVSMTASEIEPFATSNRYQGRTSTSLVLNKELRSLPAEIKQLIYEELVTLSKDTTDPQQSDRLNALYICHRNGLLVKGDMTAAWNFLRESARAGSKTAQAQMICYIVLTGDLSGTATTECFSWSIQCLHQYHPSTSVYPLYDYLGCTTSSICEKALRSAVHEYHDRIARRNVERDKVVDFEELASDMEVCKSFFHSTLGSLLRGAIQKREFEVVCSLIKEDVKDSGLRNQLLQILLEYAILCGHKQLIFLLVSKFNIDIDSEQATTKGTAMHLALFEKLNHSVIWLSDLGAKGSLFVSQPHFARIVCTSTWTMTNTFVQTCWTHYKEGGWRTIFYGELVLQGTKVPPPLFLAILARNGETFSALLRFPIDLKQVWNGWTPLSLAVSQRLPHFVAMMLERGFDNEYASSNEDLLDALSSIISSSPTDLSEIRQSLVDLVILDKHSNDRWRQSLFVTRADKYTDILMFDLLYAACLHFESEPLRGLEAIKLSIIEGNLALAQHIQWKLSASNSMDVSLDNLEDDDGRNLLWYAIEDEDFEAAEQLLSRGSSINHKNVHGSTILQQVSQSKNDSGLRFCLSHGSEALQKDIYGCTAFHRALQSQIPNNLKIVSDHSNGQVFQDKTSSGETFLHLAVAVESADLLRFLLGLYQQVSTDNEGRWPTLNDLNFFQDDGHRTYLHALCLGPKHPNAQHGSRLAMLKILLSEHDIKPDMINAVDCLLNSALHEACNGSNHPDFSIDCATMLIEYGAAINVANCIGNTPLHLAYEVAGQNEELISLLGKHGADASLKNQFDCTPAMWGELVASGDHRLREARDLCQERFDQAHKLQGLNDTWQRKRDDRRRRIHQDRQEWIAKHWLETPESKT